MVITLVLRTCPYVYQNLEFISSICVPVFCSIWSFLVMILFVDQSKISIFLALVMESLLVQMISQQMRIWNQTNLGFSSARIKGWMRMLLGILHAIPIQALQHTLIMDLLIGHLGVRMDSLIHKPSSYPSLWPWWVVVEADHDEHVHNLPLIG
jgi:hypothetical protein